MNRRHRLGYYLVAFLLPVFIITIIFALYQIIPFGEKWNWGGDFFAQIYPFMSELGRKLQSGGSMFYTWNLGLGSNFFAILVYYLICPFHLVLAFIPQSYILVAVSIASIMRFGFAGLSMYFYMEHHYKLQEAEKMNRIFAVAMSMFYALSPFVLYFFTFTMWMDVIILFPLVLAGIDRLVHKKKSFLYLFALTAAIMVNYYMAIMVCIFCVAYFAVEYFVCTDRPFARENRGILVRFLAASLVAGAINAVFIFPELFAILGADAGQKGYDFSRNQIWYTLFRNVIFNMIEDSLQPHFFATVFAIFAIPVYFISKQISRREKIGRGILFGCLIVSFTFDICIYICNGFHIPNGYPVRWAYIFVFLTLITSFEGVMRTEKIKGKYIAYYTLLLVFLYVTVINSRYSIWLYMTSGILFQVIFSLIFYGAALYLFFRQKRVGFVVLMLMFVLESYRHTSDHMQMNFGISDADSLQNHTESEINENNAAIKQLLEEIGHGLVRVEEKTSYTSNGGVLNGYKTTSAYTSMVNDKVTEFYEKIGLGNAKNMYDYEGATPVTEGIFGVHYTIVSEHEAVEQDIYQQIARSGEKILYENPYASGILYGVTQDIQKEELERQLAESDSVIHNQNTYLKGFTGVEDVFAQIPVTEEGEKYRLTVPAGAILYASDIQLVKEWWLEKKEIQCPFDNKALEVYSNGKQVFAIEATPEERTYEYTLKSREEITTEEERKKYEENQKIPEPEFYVLNTERYKEAMSILNENPVEIENYTDDSLQGRIIMKENGWIMTSIPADRGWSISVDGKKIEAEKFADAFLCFPLDAGEHEITMKYIPAGFYPGLWITIAGLGAFLVWWCMEKFRIRSEQRL